MTVERVVVIAAAGLAAFPLYQWYAERADRRLSRVASVVEAISVCSEFAEAVRREKEGLTEDSDWSLGWTLPLASIDTLCNEMMLALVDDPEAAAALDDTTLMIERLKRRFQIAPLPDQLP